MFNRSREVEQLSQMLKSAPKLSVVTGPVNSGKSKLIEYVIARVSADNPNRVPIHVANLRQGTYNSVQSLVESLSSDMKSWVKKIKENVEGVSVSEVTFHLTSHLTKGTPLDRLNYLLKCIAKELPSYSVLRGKQMPIFFIDEANRLRSLLCNTEGQAALESLFQWFVLNTKEKRRFHVIMASSDSFYHLWVEKFIGSSRYSTYVLGHLDKSDARRYWSKVVVDNMNLFKNRGLDPPKFDDIYAVCGGSMFLMSQFLEEYCEEGGEGLIGENPHQFSMVLQEQRKLVSAFEPTKTFEENNPPPNGQRQT